MQCVMQIDVKNVSSSAPGGRSNRSWRSTANPGVLRNAVLRNGNLPLPVQVPIRSDFSSGVHSGVNGTTTFFINGTCHDAPFDYETLVLAVQEESGKGKAVIA